MCLRFSLFLFKKNAHRNEVIFFVFWKLAYLSYLYWFFILYYCHCIYNSGFFNAYVTSHTTLNKGLSSILKILVVIAQQIKTNTAHVKASLLIHHQSEENFRSMEEDIERFDIHTNTYFPMLLGDFGRDAIRLFSNMPNQFVCAAFVSYREMENRDIHVITEARAQLRFPDRCRDDFRDNFVSNNRLVLLLNLPVAETSVHGEARLLDYDSKLC